MCEDSTNRRFWLEARDIGMMCLWDGGKEGRSGGHRVVRLDKGLPEEGDKSLDVVIGAHGSEAGPDDTDEE